MRAVLLVPSEAWRERLLAGGPCGALPPRVIFRQNTETRVDPASPLGISIHEVEGGTWEDYEPGDAWQGVYGRDAALVLAWDGAIVREGRDRTAYVLAEALEGEPPEYPPVFRWDETFGWTLTTPRAMGSSSAGVNAMLRGQAPPADAGDLRPAWALATVCAARGLGTVVVPS